MTDEYYDIPSDFDAEEYFSNYYGVIIGTDWEPQEVKIKVANDQVRYFDTLPLHVSQQKMEEESDEYFTIYRYHLAPTHDFKKEIMSWGGICRSYLPRGLPTRDKGRNQCDARIL